MAPNTSFIILIIYATFWLHVKLKNPAMGYTPHLRKVKSKITLWVDLARIDGVTDTERVRLLEKLESRLVGGSTWPDLEGGGSAQEKPGATGGE
jgi:hypothetical protein